MTGTLVFDVLGTVLDEDAGRLAAARDEIGPDAPAFVARWEELLDTAVGDVRELRRPYANEETLSAAAISAAAAEHGLTLGAARLDRLVGCGRRLEPFPDVPAAMERLAASWALVALTNAGAAQALAMSRYAGLRWTALVSGETVPAYKPDPRAYAHLRLAWDLDPAACVFVAAHPWDLDAAAREGFRTAYVDRTGSTPAALAAYAERFDHVVPDLVALADRLGA